MRLLEIKVPATAAAEYAECVMEDGEYDQFGPTWNADGHSVFPLAYPRTFWNFEWPNGDKGLMYKTSAGSWNGFVRLPGHHFHQELCGTNWVLEGYNDDVVMYRRTPPVRPPPP
jgi:hypothetical protein